MKVTNELKKQPTTTPNNEKKEEKKVEKEKTSFGPMDIFVSKKK